MNWGSYTHTRRFCVIFNTGHYVRRGRGHGSHRFHRPFCRHLRSRRHPSRRLPSRRRHHIRLRHSHPRVQEVLHSHPIRHSPSLHHSRPSSRRRHGLHACHPACLHASSWRTLASL